MSCACVLNKLYVAGAFDQKPVLPCVVQCKAVGSVGIGTAATVEVNGYVPSYKSEMASCDSKYDCKSCD